MGYFELNYKNIRYAPSPHAYASDKLPEYIFDSIRNSRTFYKGPIHVIVDKAEAAKHQKRFEELGCIVHETEDLITNSHIPNFLSLIADEFPNIFNDHFLAVTFMRLLLLEALAAKEKLVEVVHIENDNLIYVDLEKCVFDKSRSVWYTPVSPNLDSAGFLYFTDHKNYGVFCTKLLGFLARGYEQCRVLAMSDMITEMHVLNIVRSENPNLVGALPILPNPSLTVIFDGASWGQYLGGSNNGHPAGTTFPHQIAGVEIAKHKHEYKFNWKDRGLWLNYDNRDYQFINLHVHNKVRIKEFIK